MYIILLVFCSYEQRCWLFCACFFDMGDILVKYGVRKCVIVCYVVQGTNTQLTQAVLYS